MGPSDSLACSIWGSGGQRSVFLRVGLHSLPHGSIQQLCQLYLCLLQKLGLHSLQDKTGLGLTVPPGSHSFLTVRFLSSLDHTVFSARNRKR